MAGIVSYGAYIPRFRLGRESQGWNSPAERSVASFDEDSVTMAVAAVADCLNGRSRQSIDALFFASTTAPYAEKLSSTLVATASDLGKEVFTVDFGNSLRAGTAAMKLALDSIKAGSARQVLVVAADCRLGKPRSAFEQNSGDGAAAVLLGDSDVAVDIQGGYSLSQEIIDVWRVDGDTQVRSWEERFYLEEGYFKIVPAAVSGLLRQCKLDIKDIAKVVIYAPDSRRHREMVRNLKLGANQIQDPLFGALGNTGTAFVLMQLVAALENAKAGDKILVAGYGNGADAYLLQVGEGIDKLKDRRGVKSHLASKNIIPDYMTYLWWRGLFAPDPGIQLRPKEIPSAPALFREQDDILKFYGAKCKSCGAIQYPPQRFCTKCHALDSIEKVRLAEKRATLFTYTLDHLSGSKDMPQVTCVINFEGGGRMMTTMADRDLKAVKIGMPLEMTFRRLYYADGIYNYYWKAMPVRA